MQKTADRLVAGGPIAVYVVPMKFSTILAALFALGLGLGGCAIGSKKAPPDSVLDPRSER